MFSLIKKYFMASRWITYILLALLLTILYIGGIPPYFLFFVFLLGFILTSFYMENRFKIRRFLLSLPLSRRTIILGHYCYLLIVGLAIIAWQYLLMQIIPNIFDGTYYIYDGKDILILICMLLLFMSLTIPLYYGSLSFMITSVIVMIGVFLGVFFLTDGLVEVLEMHEVIVFNDLDPGFSLLVEKHLPKQPYLMLFFGAILLWILSLFFTEKLLSVKDC